MNIVETEIEFTVLSNRLHTDQFYMELIPMDDERHSANNTISLIFIEFSSDYECWCVPINHNEVVLLTDILDRFKKELGSSRATKLIRDKKSAINLLGRDYDFVDVNVIDYLESGIRPNVDIELTNAHKFIKAHFRSISNINRCVPLYKHASLFEQNSNVPKFKRSILKEPGFVFLNNTMSVCFAELESIGMKVNPDEFLRIFGSEQKKHIKDLLVRSEYNMFTSTGRPSNSFGGVNYAALNKTDGSRNTFESRYGSDGMLVMMDYSAFHPRLVAHLINYPMGTDINPYEYLAKAYFNKKTVDEEDVAVSKILTFQQIYGGFDKKWMYIPYFKKVQEYIDHRWKFFEKNGYIETPVFSRKIKPCHIEDPTPNKLFNYILQAYETEMAVGTLKNLLDYCRSKKTKPTLYTYDSILFDAHKDDKINTIRDLKDIMEEFDFPVKVYIGKNYAEMNKIDLTGYL